MTASCIIRELKNDYEIKIEHDLQMDFLYSESINSYNFKTNPIGRLLIQNPKDYDRLKNKY